MCGSERHRETSTGDPCEKSTGRWSTGANLSSWIFFFLFFYLKKKKKFGEGRRWRRCGKKREADGADCVPPLFCLSSAIFARPLSGGRRTPPRKKYSDAIFFFFKKKKGGKRTNLGRGLFDYVRHLRFHSETLCGRVPLIFVSICCWWGLGTYLTCI